jgi:hypothetical protein
MDGLADQVDMANVPKQHHYVPQLLLAGFTISGTKTGRQHVVDLKRRKAYKSTPEGTGSEHNYNLIEIQGVDPFLIESDLFGNEIEGPAGPALEELRAASIPASDAQARLLAFVAIQAIRSPGHRESLDDFETQLRRQMVTLMTESEETFKAFQASHLHLQGVTREEAVTWAKNTTWKNSPTGHLQVQLPAFGPILTTLEDRSWTVLTAIGAEFVCTDNPVVLFSGDRPMNTPLGFGSADGAVLMPVGRRHALLGMFPPEGLAPQWRRMDADARTVATLNTHLLAHASRFVASSRDNFMWMLADGTVADRAAFIERVRTR